MPRHAQGFILLQENRFDPDNILNALQRDWGITPDADAEATVSEATLTFNVNGNLCSVAHMPAPIPNHEAEQNAAYNYFWPEAVATVRRHRAHLLVVVLPLDQADADPVAIMSLYSKLVCACLRDDNALGVYTSGTVFAPDFYREKCDALHHDELPIMAWIFIGLYGDENGNGAYTIGLEQFNKMELEILASRRAPGELHAFLCNICDYLIAQDVTLRDGETIGFSADEKLTITRSPRVIGIAEETLKIGY